VSDEGIRICAGNENEYRLFKFATEIFVVISQQLDALEEHEKNGGGNVV